jgi:leader peptidase (prepilin peptidase)/N-methyltransferase
MSLLLYLETHPFAFPITAGILGLIVGSFLNVVILRLPVMLEREWRRQCHELLESQPSATPDTATFNLWAPRSHCPHCGHLVSAVENVPVISFLALKGRCSACRERISARYPGVELLSGLLAVVVALRFGFGPQAAAALLLTWALVALSFIDLDQQLLPDNITLPFLWLGLGLNLFAVFTPTQASLIGAMVGYLLLWSVYQLFRLATGKEGMGYGDFKLTAMLGAWLGWKALPLVVVLSSLLGALVGVALIVWRGRDRRLPIPFGPFIAVSGWVALLWGGDLTAWYLAWSGYR